MFRLPAGIAFACFKSYLSDHYHFVALNEEMSSRSQVQYGVPQGSVLGLLLFTLYMLPSGDIIWKHGISLNISNMPMILSCLFLQNLTKLTNSQN